MKLEAVDKRNTMLIRVVTVVDTDDHRIKVGAASAVLIMCMGGDLGFLA